MYKRSFSGGNVFMWTVVYINYNREIALDIKEKLEVEGLLSKIKAAGKKETQMYEILVLEGEVSDAHEIINEVIF